MKGSRHSTRIQVVLVCEKCGSRNYKASRPRVIDGKPLENYLGGSLVTAIVMRGAS